MASAEQWIITHITDEIIHPAHIPFEIKSKPVIFYTAGYLRPCSRFFCDQHGIRIFFLEDRIQVFQEFNSIQVLVAAIHIGYPLTVIFAIIQVQHGSYRVKTNSICMELVCPEQCIGNQEVLNLRSSIIVDQSSPMWMGTLPWIKVFIQACAIKGGKSKSITRKMCRYPVKNHTDSCPMQSINKIHKIFRRTVAAGWSVITGYLITPGCIKRMFHNRHQFYMGISHFLNIFNQKWGNLSIIIEFPSVIRFLPRSQMHLIHHNR